MNKRSRPRAENPPGSFLPSPSVARNMRDLVAGNVFTVNTERLGVDKGRISVVVEGIATTGVPVTGRQAICYAPALRCDEYPFDYCVIPELFLDPVDSGQT